MVSASIIECIGGTPLVRLRRLFSGGPQVYAKLELLNPGGSVKDRPARYIIERGLRDGTIAPGATIVESSSGNFGIALAMAARIYELDFVCVVDPRIAPLNLRILEQLGARVEMVQRPDRYGGYLYTRLERVQELLAEIPGAYWIDQYANELNAQCHYDGIGSEIVEALGAEEPVDVFVGGRQHERDADGRRAPPARRVSRRPRRRRRRAGLGDLRRARRADAACRGSAPAARPSCCARTRSTRSSTSTTTTPRAAAASCCAARGSSPAARRAP